MAAVAAMAPAGHRPLQQQQRGLPFPDSQIGGLHKLADRLDVLTNSLSKQVWTAGSSSAKKSLQACTSMPLLLGGPDSKVPLWHRPKRSLSSAALPPLERSVSAGALASAMEEDLGVTAKASKQASAASRTPLGSISSFSQKKGTRLIFGAISRSAAPDASKKAAKAPLVPALDLQNLDTTAEAADDSKDDFCARGLSKEVQERRVRPGDSLLLLFQDEEESCPEDEPSAETEFVPLPLSFAFQGLCTEVMNAKVSELLTEAYSVAVTCVPYSCEDLDYDGFSDEEV